MFACPNHPEARDGALAYIRMYGLTYDDVRMGITRADMFIVETKREIELGQTV